MLVRSIAGLGRRGAVHTGRVRLLVIYQHAPTPGAPGIYRHRLLLGELVRRGWRVDLVASPINYMSGSAPDRYAGRWHVREEIDGITHHWVRAAGDVHRNFRRRAANYVSFAAAATARAVSLPRPDVVWASSPPLSVAGAGHAAALRHGCPFVLEVRDLWPESAAAAGLLADGSRAYRTVDWFARRWARSADLAIVPTPGLVEPVREHGARQVRLVTGATTDNPPDAAVRARVREELGLPADACVFVYAGAHGVVNGLDVLLAAVRRAVADPDIARRVRVVLAGDGSARAALERDLASQPIAELQMLGAVPKQRVPELLAAADMGLHLLRPDPLFAGALPTKVLEYLGCHLPFLTTVPGLPAQVAQAAGGDFTPDAEALATAITSWAQLAPDERRNRGEQAFAYGDEHYGLAASVDRLEDALRTAVETRARSRK